MLLETEISFASLCKYHVRQIRDRTGRARLKLEAIKA